MRLSVYSMNGACIFSMPPTEPQTKILESDTQQRLQLILLPVIFCLRRCWEVPKYSKSLTATKGMNNPPGVCNQNVIYFF